MYDGQSFLVHHWAHQWWPEVGYSEGHLRIFLLEHLINLSWGVVCAWVWMWVGTIIIHVFLFNNKRMVVRKEV